MERDMKELVELVKLLNRVNQSHVELAYGLRQAKTFEAGQQYVGEIDNILSQLDTLINQLKAVTR